MLILTRDTAVTIIPALKYVRLTNILRCPIVRASDNDYSLYIDPRVDCEPTYMERDMNKPERKSYYVRAAKGQYVVYHWDARRAIYVGGQPVSYEVARHAVACTNRGDEY